MFTKQSDSFRKFAILVGKIGFLKKLLHPIYYKYLSFINDRRNKLFLKNALLVLDAFDKCLRGNGVQYTLAFGSMLGAVREHGFIKHDLDIDVAIWAEDYSDKLRVSLIEHGFKITHTLLVDNGELGREETYERDGVSIDIFYIYPAIDKYPYTCDFIAHKDTVSFRDCMQKHGNLIARRVQLPWKKEFIRVDFETLKLPITTNAQEILSYRYGPDYMIPNPKWVYYESMDSTIVWKEHNAVMI